MNFTSIFKNLATSYSQFPYSIDETPYHRIPFWDLFKATDKDSNPVTIFKSVDKSVLVMNCLSMIRKIKLPGLIKIVDINETEEYVYIVTEIVEPVTKLNDHETIMALVDFNKFYSNFSKFFKIGKLSKENLFINSIGELVLFGLECCVERNNDNFQYISMWENFFNVDCKKTESAVVANTISQVLKSSKFLSNDSEIRDVIKSYSNGKTKFERFNQKLFNCKVIASDFNELVSIYEKLKEIHILNANERSILLRSFLSIYYKDNLKLSSNFMNNFVVPELIRDLNNEHEIFDPMFLMALFDIIFKNEIHSHDKSVKEIIYKMFGLPQRQIRFILLIHLGKIMDHFPVKELRFNDMIFNKLMNGINDNDSNIRLLTLKTIPTFVSTLTERQLNNELIRYIAKLQIDKDEEIRKWTILIILKISETLKNYNLILTILNKSFQNDSETVTVKLCVLYGIEQLMDNFEFELIIKRVINLMLLGLMDKHAEIRFKSESLFNKYMEKINSEIKNRYSSEINGMKNKKFEDYNSMLDDKSMGNFFTKLNQDFIASNVVDLNASMSNLNINNKEGEDEWDGFNEDDAWNESKADDGWNDTNVNDGWDDSNINDGWGDSNANDNLEANKVDDEWDNFDEEENNEWDW
ncbi:hypothetical protein KAFR_0J02060 [Kazachstania africana CBS 2517]|uniref:Condensin complex subunit 1 C-terminal domain-containing protein n=1 Tax=Kazachstania africana (strain ATCC 22294 / BCRC 22015 / CBS 2517 / CECT 1963 / NBRC 1671 / NRRL Y-8276) TaxID=1071382 RepID=H2B0X0_KAZAF|nr:hypothetical protein KAFR_0J02060 [Kazachstania africana CBS 2517]CCF60270.1 hypothetical protein KAFR_0J02060 [Kazachstania africana CBS 2517]